ncbi:MAG TPA: transporter substrate-binding domain-containing protein [Nitrospiraceae bacterium]|nr:transporter substrate-binding domain-containing protein [Nitrospiraceae bacterium]
MIIGRSIISVRSIIRRVWSLKPLGSQGIVPVLIALGYLLQGCGLIFDAVELVQPLVARDEISAICSRGQLRVGISVEPFRPFVFPAVYTDEGVRVTGLDVELIREVADALTTYCGGQKPIVPTMRLTRFRDLFIEMNEGNLDIFVSSIGANIPGAVPVGLWYSIPYFHNGGIGAMIQKPEVAERVRAQFQKQAGDRDTLAAIQVGFSGLTVAAQRGRTSSLYAEANLKTIRLLICDSLPASVETKDPHIDVILSQYSILDYVTKHVWPDWHLLTRNDGTPLILTQESFSIVTVDENRRLQWFLNNLLYRMEESGRLEQMRRRWLEEDYAPTRRAATEGLPFEISKVPEHYDQGQCRFATGR